MKFTSAAVAALGLVSSVSAAAFKKRAATDPIVVKGSKFFHKNSGEQFFMNGVAYQTDLSLVDASDLPAGQQFVDPLTDIESCKRDVPLLEALHTNVIRVYAIDTTKSQDACMKLLSDAGIYVIADLSEPGLSVNRDAPAWDHHLYERYTAVIDKLQKYDNVMGFFAGNEVTNNKSNTDASPFVKASVRDMKAYIKEMKYREIPVGYATNDDEFVRDQLADYFNCGPAEESVDFWGYNIYSWCGQSSLKTSGWDKRTEEYEDYNVPVFFAEYGCNEPSPRKFTEVQALYGDEMTPVFSGGIVYMYFQEANNYGLVKVDKSGKATKLSDFNSLESQLESVKPKGVKMSSYTPANTKARSCPAQSENWKASAELPPKPDQPTCECLRSQLTCVPAPNLAEKKYGDIFGYICGQLGEGGCDGIATDGANGVYGSYSMCDAEIRLGWALTQYYESQNSAASACDFDRQARIATPTSLNSTCSKMVDAAGGTAGKALGSTGTKTGENSSSSDKPSAGSCLTPPAGLSTLVVLVASFLGMGMIML